jgi:signal peptidase I
VDPRVNFIKRLVGVPGDTITYRDKKLYINGEAVPAEEKGFFTSKQVKCSTPAGDALMLEETVGDVTHRLLHHTRTRGRDGRWVVPEGHYFVMGDNRDRSNDSREWGFVPEDHLMGRAVGIWLNFDYTKGCGDLSRIGNGIE